MVLPQLSVHDREAFLAGQHIGVLSVANDNGRPPHTVPVLYAYEPGGNITVGSGRLDNRTRKTDLIQRSGVVSLCVQREEFPYAFVTVEGTVIQTDKPPSTEQMLTIVRRYQPEEQAQAFVKGALEYPGSELVLFTIRPDHWLSADFAGVMG